MVQDLFRKALESRSNTQKRAWLVKQGVHVDRQKFVASELLKPVKFPDLRRWQAAVDQYMYNGPKRLTRIRSVRKINENVFIFVTFAYKLV